MLFYITLERGVEEHCEQSNEAWLADDEIEDDGCNQGLKWRDPQVVKVLSASVEAVNIVWHQVGHLTDARLFSEGSLTQYQTLYRYILNCTLN